MSADIKCTVLVDRSQLLSLLALLGLGLGSFPSMRLDLLGQSTASHNLFKWELKIAIYRKIRNNPRRDSRFWTSGTRARTLALQAVQVSNRENREIRDIINFKLIMVTTRRIVAKDVIAWIG